MRSLTGTLEVQRPGAPSPLPLATTDALLVGDVAATGANSKASLLFSGGSQLALNANTIVELLPASQKDAPLFRLVRGEAFARLRPGLSIQTASATASVRGTALDLVADASGTTTLTVTEGEVFFFNARGNVTVLASQRSIARPGQAPTAPVTIGNTGFLIEWTLDLERVVLPREKFFHTLDQRAVTAEAARRAVVVAQQPNNATARRALGEAFFDAGQFARALQEFEAANRLVPRDALTLARLGDTLLALNRPDDADARFRAALGAAPNGDTALRSEIYVGLAWADLQRGRPADAQTNAQTARDVQDGVASRVALGIALTRQPGRLNEAIALLEGAQTLEPTNLRYQADTWLALAHLGAGDLEGALVAAKSAVDAAPLSALAHSNLAQVLFFAGQPNPATREAKRAVALNPNSVAARVALGQALLAGGEVDRAEGEAARAVALDPQSPEARYLLGVVNAQLRDYPHAIRELQAGLRLAPDFLPLANALARVYNRAGRKGEAVQLLDDLLARNPRSDTILAARAETYYEQANYRQAAESYRAALQIRGRSALYDAGLALALLYSNRLSEALDAARQAAFLAPQVAQYHAILGLALQFCNLEAYAERQFRQALVLDPQNPLARLLLGLRAPDVRTVLNSVNQAVLLEPAIADQTFRGGVQTEITPSLGTDRERNLEVERRDTALSGRAHSYLNFQHGSVRNRDDIANNGQRQDTLTGYGVFTPTPRTNAYFGVLGQHDRVGLPGPDSAPAGLRLNNFAQTNVDQAQLAVRHRLGAGVALWAGLVYEAITLRRANPDLIFYPGDTAIARDFGVRVNELNPELRLDWTLNRAADHPTLLSFGGAFSRPTGHINYQVVTDPTVPPSPLLAPSHNRYGVAYAQVSQQVNNKLSFVAQLRQVRLQQRTPLLQVDATTAKTLPSITATYQLNQRTTFRLFALRRIPLPFAANFTPDDTLLTTENEALLLGEPDRQRTVQLDIERYQTPRDFFKLFLFETRAVNLDFGGNNVPDISYPTFRVPVAKRRGVGFRYERQISTNLFSAFSLVLNRTRAEGAGQVFDGQTAPYQPKRSAGITLNYINPNGNKAQLNARYQSSFFQDSLLVDETNGRPRYPSRVIFDLRLAKEPSVHREFFLQVTNLFNARQISFNDFSTGRRRFLLGVTNRF